MKDKTKQRKFLYEKDKLKKIFEALPADIKIATAGLLDNVVFLSIQLKELQQAINENGLIDEWENGKQRCTRTSANVQVYNSLIKSYNTAVKTLLSALKNKEEKQEAQSALMKFLSED